LTDVQTVINDLYDKTALVTGAGRGLGKAIALTYCRVGCNVIGVARTVNELKETFNSSKGLKGIFKYFRVDISNGKDVEELFNKIRSEYGYLNILVNNAGILRPKAPIEEISIEDWNLTVDTNLKGVFLCLRYGLPIMKKGDGSIINLTSGVTTHPAPYWAPYAVSKHGVEVLTKIAADELKEKRIRVNAVNPGRMRTAILPIAYPNEDPSKYPKPTEKVGLFLYLASKQSASINGQIINLEDWVSSHPKWRDPFRR